jgi:electron transfer flavoprotein beta subunit
MQIVGERLGIVDQFQGVDRLTVLDNGSLEVLERIESGCHQRSVCAGPPMVVGWATGHLSEPPNNPQIGMANMRSIMPALQRAKPAPAGKGASVYGSVAVPRQVRETRVVKDLSPDAIAREIVEWISR